MLCMMYFGSQLLNTQKFELERDPRTKITVLKASARVYDMYGIYSKMGMDYGVWKGMGHEGT